ncbi:MAG: nicotinate (nicotinamide) nucleotide adenylyltransferase [Phycisphaerales bacterium]|nr:nicotinate (nicotinamide) nucleotide adenylyltransferase [Phycisphaerales bacterium]
MSAPIIIFGGSFDPPTIAHRVLPLKAAEIIGAQRIIYVPAAISPHKLDTPPTDAAHRLAMLELVLHDASSVCIDQIELDREGPSYSIDTVRTLRKQFDSDVPLRLLIGDDQAVAFHRWKDWNAIIELAEPLVLPRLHESAEAFSAALEQEQIWSPGQIDDWCRWRLDLPIMEVQATIIRERLERGEAVDELVDADVLRYIHEYDLYNCTA